MPLVVILAVVGIAAAIPIVWWSFASAQKVSSGDVSSNLSRGLAAPTDLRNVLLTKSASERAVRPMMRRLADQAGRLMPAGLVASLERKIVLAGRPADWPIERVLAAKLVLGVTGLILGLMGIS